MIINKGSNRLLATLVGFRWTDTAGTTRERTFGINDFNSVPASQIGPGEGRLFVLQRGLNVYFARRKADPESVSKDLLTQWGSLIGDIANLLRNSQNITAFIDSVAIENVGLVGPDTRNMRSHGWDRTTTY